MTVRTIATRSQGDVENQETFSPMHVETEAHRIVMEPEPAHTYGRGMSTPTMRNEGIAAVDYFAFNHGDQDDDKDQDPKMKVAGKNAN
jgi:hypothetical protein